MQDFDAALTRAFAEAPEPDDAGFAADVAAQVARRERWALLRAGVQALMLALAAAAVLIGLGAAFGAFGLDALAEAQALALRVSRLHLAIGLTQILAAAAAVAAAGMVYQARQQD